MKKRKNTEKFWDKIARHYDRIESKDKMINDRIIEKTKHYLKTNDTVLDFGCGSGTAAIGIADRVETITAIDISANMIEIAKKEKCKSIN